MQDDFSKDNESNTFYHTNCWIERRGMMYRFLGFYIIQIYKWMQMKDSLDTLTKKKKKRQRIALFSSGCFLERRK